MQRYVGKYTKKVRAHRTNRDRAAYFEVGGLTRSLKGELGAGVGGVTASCKNFAFSGD